MRVKGIQRVKDPFKVPWNFLGNARIARLMEVLTLPHTHEEPMQKPLGPVCVCVCLDHALYSLPSKTCETKLSPGFLTHRTPVVLLAPSPTTKGLKEVTGH